MEFDNPTPRTTCVQYALTTGSPTLLKKGGAVRRKNQYAVTYQDHCSAS
jgi:hypothetical protein